MFSTLLIDTEKLFTRNCQVLPLDVATPRDPYAWKYRELATLLNLSESLVEGGFEPLIIGSMRKNLTTELSRHLCCYAYVNTCNAYWTQ